MIRPLYALTLARTKLRSKRGTLFASTIVASLLFAALITITIAFSGAQTSADRFIKKAGNDRYLVAVSPFIPYDKILLPQELSAKDIQEIKAYEKRYYEKERDTYEKLGLEYTQNIDEPALEPAPWMSEDVPAEQRVGTNFRSPVIEAMTNDRLAKYVKTANNKFQDLRAIGSKHKATGYYAMLPSYFPAIPSTRLIQNGSEDFSSLDRRTGADIRSYTLNAIYNSDYGFIDQHLLDRYLLTKDASTLKGVPVVVSAQEAASLFGKPLGIGKEPQAASDKLAWLKSIQEKLNGHTYETCYRNEGEQAMLEKIKRDYAEMQANKDTAGYQKPSLIYDYPKKPCGDIVVKQDTRSPAEKEADAEAEETQKRLGNYVKPAHRLIRFQIVGFINSQPASEYSTSAENFVKSLLSKQENAESIMIPTQLYEALPAKLKIDDIRKEFRKATAGPLDSKEYAPRVLEFTSVDQARDFLSKEACSEFAMSCNKQFTAAPYGSNYLILDEIGKLFNKVATIAFPIALGLAAIIIWFTVSRIMSENRRETAVYRAMGARRRDVTAIYVVYIFIVALRIALIAAVLGVAAAFIIDRSYGKNLTDTAVSAFGIIDGAPSFTLFNIESPLLLGIIGSIFAISFIASIQPLIRNVRRSPIRDMRDDG